MRGEVTSKEMTYAICMLDGNAEPKGILEKLQIKD